MTIALFMMMVVLLGLVFGLSAVAAHTSDSVRPAFGWWAGVVLAAGLLGAASKSFSELPAHTVTDACSTSRQVDWEVVASDAIHVNWATVAIGVIFAVLALEIVERLEFSPRVLALLLLVMAFSSSLALVYVFLIRKLTYLVFSMTIGAGFGSLLYGAFIARGSVETDLPESAKEA
jgi:hypothetical protein